MNVPVIKKDYDEIDITETILEYWANAQLLMDGYDGQIDLDDIKAIIEQLEIIKSLLENRK